MELLKDILAPLLVTVIGGVILGILGTLSRRIGVKLRESRGRDYDLDANKKPPAFGVNRRGSSKERVSNKSVGTSWWQVLVFSNYFPFLLAGTGMSVLFFCIFANCCFSIFSFSGYPEYEKEKVSDPGQRIPIDPRIVGKWQVQGQVYSFIHYTERTVIFSEKGKFVYAASGHYTENLGGSKEGDRSDESFTGQYWFLKDGDIEFLKDNGKVCRMGIDIVSNNEMVLTGLGDRWTTEDHLKGTLKKTNK